MPSTGYIADTFVAGEQPTTAKWNELWGNDASFNNGNGLNDGVIVSRHYGNLSIPSTALALTKTVDANGWTVYDSGNYKEYTKRTSGLFGVVVAAGSPVTYTTPNLPVGVANTSGMQLTLSAGGGSGTDPAFSSQINSNAVGFDVTGSTAIILVIRNNYTTSLNAGYWTLFISMKTL